jgi:hypothetical protein
VASLDGPELLVLDAADGDVLARFTTPGPAASTSFRTRSYAGRRHPPRRQPRDLRAQRPERRRPRRPHGPAVEARPTSSRPSTSARSRPTSSPRATTSPSTTTATAAWPGSTPGSSASASTSSRSDGPSGPRLARRRRRVPDRRRPARAGVRVFDRSETQLATFDGCPGLHGQATLGNAVAFGCSDGVLIVEVRGGGTFAANKIGNPAGSPEGARVGVLASHPASPVMVGNFGQGIAIIDPARAASRRWPCRPRRRRCASATTATCGPDPRRRPPRLDAVSGAVLPACRSSTPWSRASRGRASP